MRASRKIVRFSLAVILLFLVTLLTAPVRFSIRGHFEGFYLLHDMKTGKYDLTDHLFVGENTLLIYGIDFTGPKNRFIRKFLTAFTKDSNHLHYEWNPHDGNGMVSNYLPGGTQLVTYFGRYLDEEQEVHGLFVGGGLPETISENTNYNMNNSGMTFFDGKRWYHIWCSVNEGIGAANGNIMLTPSQWKFLGSNVSSSNDSEVVITSSHSVIINATPVLIDRKATFVAGETYFTLEIKITNNGSAPLLYEYCYGDEPWVGYYGSSLGDVGWVRDRIVNYEEVIDSAKYSYAGIVDSGNRVIGEKPVYTNLANFIEWFGDERPYVYFANKGGELPKPGTRKPLESNERFIGLEWERLLDPHESATIKLAIGMADFNEKTGIPVKPETRWK